MGFMGHFFGRSCDRRAEPDLSRNRIDDIVRGAAGMQPILEKARALHRVPEPEEAFPLTDDEISRHRRLISERVVCPLRFREGDTVSDVRRLIAVLIPRAEEIYAYRSREESDRAVPYWFLKDDERSVIQPLVDDPSAVAELLSITRGYEEAVVAQPNYSGGISGRQSHLVDTVRWSIPSDGLLSSIRWALKLHFPHRVSKEDRKKWKLRADDTPESIKMALEEILRKKPDIAHIIDGL